MKNDIYSEEQKFLVNKLKQARIDCGLDQIDVATQINKTQSYLSKVESGQRKVDVILLKKLASIYKKEINFFIPKEKDGR